jgi:hypothetical protein
MKMKKGIALLGLSVVLFSCGVATQVLGAYALTQCKYIFKSITGLNIAGLNLQNGSLLNNTLAAANLLSAINSPNGSLPINFTLNLDVTNPGIQTALLNSANYILEVDGIQLTQGAMDHQIQIASGQNMTLPIAVGFDLKKVMSGKSADTMKNLVYNFAGIGNSSSNVTLKLQPSFMVNGSPVSTPSYIPISFTLNKK